MLEYEMKLPLTRGEYDRLLELKEKGAEGYEQINYYYDTHDLEMNKRGITCRVRERDGTFAATKKTHHADGCSTEESCNVSGVRDTWCFGGDVMLYGEMITHRTVLYNLHGVEAVLDRNTYLGMTDYELEIEYDPEDRACAECVFNYYADYLDPTLTGEAAVEFAMRITHAKSKSARFFDRYARISANREEVTLDEVIEE